MDSDLKGVKNGNRKRTKRLWSRWSTGPLLSVVQKEVPWTGRPLGWKEVDRNVLDVKPVGLAEGINAGNEGKRRVEGNIMVLT